jgi:elongation factor Ts
MADKNLVVKLREITGAGMMDCSKALDEAAGDLEKAAEILRKNGTIKAAKRSDRVAKEGVIAMAKTDNKVAIVGVACETDFVSHSEGFVKTAGEYAEKLLAEGEETFKAWADEDIKNNLVVKIGEKIQLSFAEIIEGNVLGSYVHSNKKLAAVVVMSGGTQELANEIAMQVAAMSPKYLNPESVDPVELEKEKSVYREQLKNEGKPEAIWDKIMEGKMAKFYSEVCLTKQASFKDEDMTIEAMVQKSGADIKIESFKRFSL